MRAITRRMNESGMPNQWAIPMFLLIIVFFTIRFKYKLFFVLISIRQGRNDNIYESIKTLNFACSK